MILRSMPALLVLALAACGGGGSDCCVNCGGQDSGGGFKLPADPKNYAPIEKYEASRVVPMYEAMYARVSGQPVAAPPGHLAGPEALE